jgi:hypothetical protein
MALTKEEREVLEQWKKELEALDKLQLNKCNTALGQTYRNSLIDIKKRLHEFITGYANMSFSKRLEAEKLFGTAGEVAKVLNPAFEQIHQTILLHKVAETQLGYTESFYGLNAAYGYEMGVIGLDTNAVRAIVDNPVAGRQLSARLHQERDKLAEEITNAVARGVIDGAGYAVVAKSVTDWTETSYSHALRIARTEGGRCRSMATQIANRELVDMGIDIQKVWVATLDRRTRHDHRELDGQTRDIDKPFTLHGMEAQMPGLFGIAGEDINCRCCTINTVDGEKPALRRDNETGEVIDFKTYNEWAKEYRAKYGDEAWYKGFKGGTEERRYLAYKSLGIKVGTFDEFRACKYKAPDLWAVMKKEKSVVAKWDKLSQKWEKRLPKEVYESIKAYSVAEYGKEINYWLRRKYGEISDEMVRDIDNIKRAFRHARLPENATLYRAASSRVEIYQGLKPGDTLERDSAFFSASLKESVALGYKGDSGRYIYTIKAQKGSEAMYIGNIAVDKSEAEVLLPPMAELKVIAIDNKKRTILLDYK